MGKVRFVIVEELDDGLEFPTGIERNPSEWRRSLEAKVAEEVALVTITPKLFKRGKTDFNQEEILEIVSRAIDRQMSEFRHLTIRLP